MKTPLINLIVYILTLVGAGVIIYIISLFHINKTIKIIITIILLAAFGYWCINTFDTYISLRIWLTNFINQISS